MSTMERVKCPHCGEEIEAEPGPVTCPACLFEVEVGSWQVDEAGSSPMATAQGRRDLFKFFAVAMGTLMGGGLVAAVIAAGVDLEFRTALLVLLGLPIYFIPALIAWKREHRNLTAIAVLNIFAGWTFFGWVGALVWALYRDKEK